MTDTKPRQVRGFLYSNRHKTVDYHQGTEITYT